MTALRKDSFWADLTAILSRKPVAPRESRHAREFAKKVYNRTGGVTPEMKRLYADLLENERRSRES